MPAHSRRVSVTHGVYLESALSRFRPNPTTLSRATIVKRVVFFLAVWNLDKKSDGSLKQGICRGFSQLTRWVTAGVKWVAGFPVTASADLPPLGLLCNL